MSIPRGILEVADPEGGPASTDPPPPNSPLEVFPGGNLMWRVRRVVQRSKKNTTSQPARFSIPRRNLRNLVKNESRGMLEVAGPEGGLGSNNPPPPHPPLAVFPGGNLKLRVQRVVGEATSYNLPNSNVRYSRANPGFLSKRESGE